MSQTVRYQHPRLVVFEHPSAAARKFDAKLVIRQLGDQEAGRSCPCRKEMMPSKDGNIMSQDFLRSFSFSWHASWDCFPLPKHRLYCDWLEACHNNRILSVVFLFCHSRLQAAGVVWSLHVMFSCAEKHSVQPLGVSTEYVQADQDFRWGEPPRLSAA